MRIIHIRGAASNVPAEATVSWMSNLNMPTRYPTTKVHWFQNQGKFRFSVNGRTLTITRIDEDGGWYYYKLRVYLSTEDIPDFTSTVYTFHGLDYEQAPRDTTEVTFHPSVTETSEI